MKIRNLVLAAVAAGAVVVPGAAQADHTCSSQIVVFSRPLSVNTNYAKCQVDSGDDVDGRFINPGSTGISLRYLTDLSVPSLDAKLNGLGFNNVTVKMNRAAITIAGQTSYVYDSATVAIPGGPTAIGCVRVDVIVGYIDEEPIIESTGFHTVGGECTDV